MNTPTISAQFLRHIADCLELTGCAPDPLLAQYELQRNELDDPRRMVPLKDFLSFFELAAEEAQNPLFGLHAGRLAGSDSLGPIGFLFLSAPTLREAFRSFTEYLATMQQAARNAFVEEGGLATFEYSISDESLQTRRQDAEYSIAAMYNFAKNYVGPGFNLVDVRFEHSPASDHKNYREYFRCDVYFDQDINSLTFDSVFLDGGSRVLDPALFPIIEEHLSRRATERQGKDTFLQQVTKLLEADPLDRSSTIAEVAGRLGVSVPTLNRRLRGEGAKWRDLVQERRMNAAARMLCHSNRGVAEIALAVGFAESASFIRSFHRHFGTTPRKFRERPS